MSIVRFIRLPGQGGGNKPGESPGYNLNIPRVGIVKYVTKDYLPKSEGYNVLILTTDTQELYQGNGPGKPLKKISGVVSYDSIDKFPKEGVEGRIYVDSSQFLLYMWDGEEYEPVSGSGGGIDVDDFLILFEQALDKEKSINIPILINGKIPISQLPAEFKETRVVQTIADRDAIDAGELYEGLFVFVVDATGDPEVSTGGAMYVYDGQDWHKVSEEADTSIVLEWENILNKPSASTQRIDDAVQKVESINNIDIVNRLGESGEKLLFNNKPVCNVDEDAINQALSDASQKATDAINVANQAKNAIDSYTDIINQYTQLINQYKDVIDQHTDTLNDYATRLDEHETKINSYDTKINEYDTKISEYDTKINDAKTAVDNYQIIIDEQADKINQQETKISEQETKIDSHETEIANILDELNTLKAELEELKKNPPVQEPEDPEDPVDPGEDPDDPSLPNLPTADFVEPLYSTDIKLEPEAQPIYIEIEERQDPYIDYSRITAEPNVIKNIELLPTWDGRRQLKIEVEPAASQDFTITIGKGAIQTSKRMNNELVLNYSVYDGPVTFEEEFILPMGTYYYDASKLTNQINELWWWGPEMDGIGRRVKVYYLGRPAARLDEPIEVPFEGVDPLPDGVTLENGPILYVGDLNRFEFGYASVGNEVYKIVKF